MRRFLAVFLAVCVAAVAACNQQVPPRATADAEEEAVPPPPLGVVNVQVFCNDTEGPGIGARINPWEVHTGDSTRVWFNIHPTPGNVTVSTRLDQVPDSLWAFEDNMYQSSDTTLTAPINPALRATAGEDRTYYKLTFTCPSGTTIVIDPIVIIDNPPPPGG